MNNTTPPSLSGILSGSDESARRAAVQALDPGDPVVVIDVLAAMTELARDFVLGAAPLQARRADGWAYFDLDKVAGYEIPGLVCGLLEARFPALAFPPTDDVLAEALEQSGFDIDDAGRRAGFFLAWMATRALHELDALARFLASHGSRFTTEQLDLLAALVRTDLSGALRLELANLLARAAPERAIDVRAAVALPYLDEAWGAL